MKTNHPQSEEWYGDDYVPPILKQQAEINTLRFFRRLRLGLVICILGLAALFASFGVWVVFFSLLAVLIVFFATRFILNIRNVDR